MLGLQIKLRYIRKGNDMTIRFYNCRILSMKDNNVFEGELWTDNDRISYVGPSNEIYDYCGVIYPEGIIDSNAMCMFNHSDIQKILYMGYVSDDFKNLLNFIHENEKNIS